MRLLRLIKEVKDFRVIVSDVCKREEKKKRFIDSWHKIYFYKLKEK
jgi:hypothetical protein